MKPLTALKATIAMLAIAGGIMLWLISLLPEAEKHTPAPAPPKRQSGVIQYIYDGDTIQVSGIGVVRLADLDAGEGVAGLNTAIYLRNELLGVRVELETCEPDRYGRTVAVVYVEGVNLNAYLVKSGKAKIDDHYNRFNPRLWE